MTRIFKTTDGEINIGFSLDTSVVSLGELPCISTQQFVGHATLALLEIIPHLDTDTREEWAAAILGVAERIGSLSLIEPAEDRIDAASRNRVGIISTPFSYEWSPFTVAPDRETVIFMMPDAGPRHVLSSNQFYALVVDGIIASMGWNGQTYQEVKDAATTLEDALLSS